MPRLASELYAAYQDGVLKLAAKQGGVSRPQIMESLNVSRSIADTMIEKCALKVARREGRTEYFVVPDTSPVPIPKLSESPPAPEGIQPPPVDVPPLAEKDDPLPPGVDEAGVVEANPLDRLADVVETDDQVIASIDHEIADTRTALREAALKAGRAMGEWATQQALVDALRDRLQGLASRRLSLTP